MKKLFKKSIACLIAVLMVFSTMPLSAFAWSNGLTFTKKDTSWTDYPGKYSAYLSDKGIDYAGIVLKEVDNSGVITVTRGQSFKITLSCGKWIKQKASKGVPQTDTLSWYFGESNDYVLSTRDAYGNGEGTKWKAFLGDDTSKEIQSNITGEFATATNGPLNKYRATSGDGGTNEAYGVFEFTTSSFPQLNTPGEYTVRLAPTIVMNTWTSKGWFQGSEWRNTKGWGAVNSTIANGDSAYLDGRTISITVKVVCPHTNTELRNKSDANCTTAGYSGDSYCTDCDTKLSTGSTVNALGHNYQIDNITYKAPTCTTAGKEADQFCTRCGDTITGKKILATGHTFENGVCTVCKTPQTFTITFNNLDGSEMSSKVYNYGQTVEIPALPPTKYTYNNETHTVTTYSWNFTPNPLAQGNATYQVTATNSEPVACNFVLKDSTTVDGKTIDTLECSVCKGTIDKTVADMSALNPAIEELEALVNADGANYKYEANALANAENVVATAKDFVQKADKYAPQSEVDKQASKVNETITTLTTTGLAQYTVTFNLVNADTGKTIETASSKMKYGDIAEKTYTFEKDEDGFPKYVVCKWTVGDAKLNTTDTSISGVVKGNATYICYVLPFKATNETQNTTRVRYLDKSGNTLKIAYAEVGSNYQIDSSVSIPKIPYYKFTKWERVYGENNPVGTRELVYQAQYEYAEVEANNCTIVGRGGISVNGSSQCTSRYDDKVILTGADKYAFCDKNGTIISYINADYIYTPHINGTVYITGVETASTKASTAVTGYFKQLNTGTTTGGTPINTLYVNAQYYLPEGATAVEAGIVISSQQKTTETLVIGGTGVLKVVSDTQGTNHEYSIGMTYTRTGTLYTRSYLICKLSDGTTKTVYSDDVTEVKLQGGADNE